MRTLEVAAASHPWSESNENYPKLINRTRDRLLKRKASPPSGSTAGLDGEQEKPLEGTACGLPGSPLEVNMKFYTLIRWAECE